jgi:hypothetical protein
MALGLPVIRRGNKSHLRSEAMLEVLTADRMNTAKGQAEVEALSLVAHVLPRIAERGFRVRTPHERESAPRRH